VSMHVQMRETLRWILWALGLLLCVQCASCQRPEKVTLCDIKDKPTLYDHKLLEVEGFVSHDFEDFSISTPECPNSLAIWLEFGGKRKSRTIYCCGGSAERTRTKHLEVEGISVPLVEDQLFRKFDKLIQPPFRSGNHGSVVHAIIIARFFLGEKQEYGDKGGWSWGGYGHFGCCSLMVIQQVRSVDSQDRDDLDYGVSSDQPDLHKLGYGNFKAVIDSASNKETYAIQQHAEKEHTAWIFDDPRRVATDALAALLKVDKASLASIKETQQGQGRVTYEWRDPENGRYYMLILSRPYWLSFYAKDPKKVAWILVAAYEACDQDVL
jgi:hypothetical protein